MSKMKKPLIFTLLLLPIAAVAGYFVIMYQLQLYDQETLEELLNRFGSIEMIILVAVLQTMVYVAICGFFGYLLSEKIGLMKPFCLEKTLVIRTLIISVFFGIILSLDYWTFGRWIPGISDSIAAEMTLYGWISSILYGGFVEEVMMRLFMMSLIAWLLWKLFFCKKEETPKGVTTTANVVAALVFAAAHLPATLIIFGELTPLLLLRCFLINGGFGLLFGRLYRKYGIQYAMMSHALVHGVSKTIWLIFI